MPKRISDGYGGGRTAKPPRHVYLVLDDWSHGYSIREIDLPSDSNSGDSVQFPPIQRFIGASIERRLPPAVFRFEAQRGMPTYFAAAFDSKIMAMPPIAPAMSGLVPKRVVPVFDVHMRSVMFGPRQTPDPEDPIYIPVGGMLFALSTGSFQVLLKPSVESDSETWVWSWYQLPEPPFVCKNVTSYTVHPDGRTIFISIRKDGEAATFTFDTAEKTSMWKEHGSWMLPFSGRACFDCALDAWVGLSIDPGAIGQLCSCDVVPTFGTGDGQCPPVKLCKELVSENPVARRVGATLLYMGNRSEFCLLECICIKDDPAGEMSDPAGEMSDPAGEMNDGPAAEMKDDPAGEMKDDSVHDTSGDSGETSDEDDSVGEMNGSRRSGYFFRLKTFFLMYDKNGDLKTGNLQVRCYEVPEAVSESICKHPIAFSM